MQTSLWPWLLGLITYFARLSTRFSSCTHTSATSRYQRCGCLLLNGRTYRKSNKSRASLCALSPVQKVHTLCRQSMWQIAQRAHGLQSARLTAMHLAARECQK